MIDRMIADPGAWSPASSCQIFGFVKKLFGGGGSTSQNVQQNQDIDIDVQVDPIINIEADLSPIAELGDDIASSNRELVATLAASEAVEGRLLAASLSGLSDAAKAVVVLGGLGLVFLIFRKAKR